MKVEPSRNETSLDTDWPNTKQALQVVIAYNDLAAGKRAMHVLAGMGKGLADHIEFRPFPWPFDLLTDANWREVVAGDAVKADILILATSDTNPLPAEVIRWVETMVSRKQETDSAIVALFGSEENPEADHSPRLDAIRTMVQKAGLAFFAPIARRELAETALQIQQHSQKVTPHLGEILHHHHPPPRWGINE